MKLFWIIFSFFTLIAMLVVLLPLLCTPTAKMDRRTAKYKRAQCFYREKLRELAAEYKKGELSKAVFQQARSEQKTLLSAELSELVGEEVNSRHSWKLIAVLIMVLPLVAVSLYLKLGSSKVLSQQIIAQNQAQKLNTEIERLGDMPHIIARLKQQVEKTNDAKGWFLLGRLYLKNQSFAEAEAALAQANRLNPGHSEITVAYVQAKYLHDNQSLDAEAKELLLTVLQQNPQQVDALNLLALDNYRQGNFAEAIKYWQQALPEFVAGSEEENILLQQIAIAEQKLQNKDLATNKVQLNFRVELAEALRSKVADNDVVFIYAQDSKGSPIPLAVTRRQVKDLPAQVVLDESMAMLPSMTLSKAEQVKIVARISKTGQAIPGPGDLMGEKNMVDVRHPPAVVTVQINQVWGD